MTGSPIFQGERTIQAMFMNTDKMGFITLDHSVSGSQTKITAYFETGGHFVADPNSVDRPELNAHSQYIPEEKRRTRGKNYPFLLFLYIIFFL